MSRRIRAGAFAALSLTCAGLAASLAGDYTAGVEAQLGELRPVVVARAEVPAGKPLRPADARELLEVRRVPARFAPADALSEPFEAIGRTVRGTVSSGTYLTDSLLRLPGSRAPRAGRPGSGKEAIEISVAGAGAVAAAGDPIGRRFDVVATGEPGMGSVGGRTRVVAAGVELLDLREAGPPEDGLGTGASSAWTATVAASRDDAIRLIHAHNYAREVRLIGGAGGR